MLTRPRAALALAALVSIASLSSHLAGCSRTSLEVQTELSQRRATLSFGTVAVGETATDLVKLPTDYRFARTFTRTFAPNGIVAPRSLTLAAGEKGGQLAIAWKPAAPGPLDAAVVYTVRRDAHGDPREPYVYRIELSGSAIGADTPACIDCAPDAGSARDAGARDAGALGCPIGPSGIACDDANPCTLDRCVAGACARTPTLEGEDCGSFDCKVAHVCAAGACATVDLSRHSDGMACDGGDPCKEDGECRAGVCYASDAPRTPRVLDSLRTFGQEVSDAATDGKVFAYADGQHGRIDLAVLQDGALEYRASVAIDGARGVKALGGGRFVVRGAADSFATLDARDPLHPQLTPLPHVVPTPTRLPEGAMLKMPYFEEKWAVVHDVLLISTATPFDMDGDDSTGWDTTYRPTSVPIDPQKGGPHSLDVHGYRMAVVGDTVMWTLPGYGTDGTQAVGVLQVDTAGKPTVMRTISYDEASAMGCDFPHEIGAFGRRFATLSTEDNAGYYRVCLWEVAADPADGFTLLKSRGLDEHVHSCGIALDERYLYFSCDTRNARGWLGELLEMGETVRFDIDAFIAGKSGLKFADAEPIARNGGALKTEFEGGYLWTVDDMALAYDLRAGREPLSGRGFGRINALLPSADGERALGGGLASFGVVQSTPGVKPRIRFDDWRVHYPRNGRLRTDIRALHAGPVVANANPMMTWHPDDEVEEVRAELAGNMISLGMRPRLVNAEQYSQSRPIAFTADYSWFANGALNGWTRTDAKEPSLQLMFAFGSMPVRTDASGAYLVSGNAQGFTALDPLAMPPRVVASGNLPVMTQYPAAPYPYAPEYTQVLVIDADDALAGSSQGVELHSASFAHDAVKLTWPDVDPLLPVALPLAANGKALATYVANDGKAWLVQLSYAGGKLREVARLETPQRVVAAAPFGTRWLLANDDGVQLADLACWPDPDDGVDAGSE